MLFYERCQSNGGSRESSAEIEKMADPGKKFNFELSKELEQVSLMWDLKVLISIQAKFGLHFSCYCKNVYINLFLHQWQF